MPRASRALVVPALVALAGAALVGWLRLLTPAFTDYEVEAEPSVAALLTGDLGGFLEHAPAYGGSLLLRAPFALLADALGGGDLAVYRALAVPALLAGAALGVWMFARARSLGHGATACWVALALCAVNPLTLPALEIGHPEELLGGVLCVAAVLAAGARRPVLAGLLLGVAGANKPWAVLAVVPVLVALGDRRERALALAACAAAGGLLLAPFVVAGSGAVSETSAVAFGPSLIFQPWQVWWFFGDHSGVVMGLTGEKVGYRTPPEWIGSVSRAVVVAVPVAVSIVVARRWHGRPWHDALALLAFALLVRCLLDPWNIVYYQLPFLLALVAWEVHARRRPPVLALGATLLAWLTLGGAPLSPDVQAATFLAWTLPLAAALCLAALSGRRGGLLTR